MIQLAPTSVSNSHNHHSNQANIGYSHERSNFSLRPYQVKVIQQVYDYFQGGKKSCLVYGPTGCGKTAIATRLIADAVKCGRRVLFCCHRTKLIQQTQDSLKRFYNLDAGVIWADNQTDYSLKVQVAMIQTLQNRDLPPDIGLVIFDECHSSAYYQISQQIMSHYSGGIFALSPCFFIGLTATPWRTKAKEGFCQFFDCLVKAPHPIDLVKMGFLCRPRLFGYGGLIDFSQLESNGMGDYTESSLQEVCNVNYNAEVIEHFLNLCPQRKAIAFCAGVKQAQDLATQFNKVGISAEVIIGDTTHSQREDIFERFRLGETQIISSVGVLCEGFDEPSVEAAIIARPTKSRALLIQMVGRALRLHPNKKDAFLLDFGECFQRLCLPTKKLPISLCPDSDFVPFSMVKECENCHAMIHLMAKICPECGYEFAGQKEDWTEDNQDGPQFGEILTEEELKQLRYIRQQMKRKFTMGQNPSRVKSLFWKKFGYFAPDEWFVGAIFGMKNVYANEQIYLDFLKSIRPNAPKAWIKYMMELEFGKPDREYRSASGRTYKAKPVILKGQQWWEILRINPQAPFEMIKAAYRELAKRWHPDVCDDETSTDMMKLINYAFESAKVALGIT
jgi:superfamily II DNA or RNA helicase